jgi:hypothetical protein
VISIWNIESPYQPFQSFLPLVLQVCTLTHFVSLTRDLATVIVVIFIIIAIILYLRSPKSVLVHLPEEIAWSYLMAENSIPKWKKRGTEEMGNNHHLLHPHPR